ncbi:MAG: glycosyltransferase [bacterium]|nr:glycosyltransferase [bacterium]
MTENDKKFRIFIGTREVSGYYHRLYKALKKQGYAVEYYCYYNPFEYASLSDYQNILGKLIYVLTKIRYGIIHKKHKKNLITLLTEKLYLFLIHILIEIISFLILIYSLFKYDVFIFSFASSIIPYPYLIDLPVLKFFKKKIISCVFHGSEARPRYISMYGINRENPTYMDFKEVYKTVKIQKQKLRNIEKYSDIVIGSYLTSHFLKKKFVDYLYIGNISPDPPENKKENPNMSNKIKILHAPSKAEMKGTSKIREVVKKLKQKYQNIEYIEITGKPNEEVIKAIQECSFVVDQLYSDTPLAVLGTEAAIYGKATITAGYVWKELYSIYPSEILTPSYLCHPSEIEEAIETLINNSKLREEIANKVHNFVLKNWSPQIIADKFISIIKNEILESWYTEPIQNYAHFCFIDEQLGKKLLKQYLSLFGDKALLLDDKPILKQEFIKIANS